MHEMGGILGCTLQHWLLTLSGMDVAPALVDRACELSHDVLFMLIRPFAVEVFKHLCRLHEMDEILRILCIGDSRD